MNTIYEEAIEKWGIDQQALVACEEMGELIQALSKYIRTKDMKHRDNILEEIVDVYIMVRQIESYFKFSDDEYLDKLTEKVAKLKKAIES